MFTPGDCNSVAGEHGFFIGRNRPSLRRAVRGTDFHCACAIGLRIKPQPQPAHASRDPGPYLCRILANAAVPPVLVQKTNR